VEVFFTICGELGMGRRLPGLLRTAGLEDVRSEAHTPLVCPGEQGRSTCCHW
jgi:hypothetical protein